MSSITDFFVARQDEALHRVLDRGPAGVFPAVQGGRADPVKILQLQCLLDGSTFEERLEDLDALLLCGGDEGPWIASVPEIITRTLARASPEQLVDVASRWASTEEWMADGGTAENLMPWLRQIAVLATQAEDSGRKLYVWTSL
jgi:hypothetical protein